MPQLKQLSCCIQWAETGAPFLEHGTAYGDGVVETFIVVPKKPQCFSIRLTSQEFIYEGLVMVVFIDGNYQCNRSRVNLVPPNKSLPGHRTEIDFLLRQREKSQGDGIYLGREWRFDNHNIVTDPPVGFQDSHFDDLGTIEVLVLRCRARNREDAEYEGSSSGEDSDILLERPAFEEQTDAQPPLMSGVIPPAAIEEEMVMGFGLFDGANDLPATYDGASGRWIWHQSRPPFATPEQYQREGYRPRSRSHLPMPGSYPADIYQDRRNVSGPAEKRVHFDVHAVPPHTNIQYRRTSDFQHPLPQRPISRVRERVPSDGSQNNPTSAYGRQRIPHSSEENGSQNGRESQSYSHTRSSPHQDDTRPAWRHDNGTSESPRETHTGNSQTGEPDNTYQSGPSQVGQAGNSGQQPERHSSFSTRQEYYNPNYTSNERSSSTAAQNTSRNGSFNNSQEVPPRRLAHQDTRRPSQNSSAPYALQPESGRGSYPMYGPAYPNPQFAAPYPYVSPYVYAHPPQMPYDPYPPFQSAGYWPCMPHNPHFNGDTATPSGPNVLYSPHPAYPVYAGSVEHVSPMNVQGNLSNPSGSHNRHSPLVGQGGQNEQTGWSSNSNGEGEDAQPWKLDPPTDNNTTSQTWDHNNGGDNGNDINIQDNNELNNNNAAAGNDNQNDNAWSNDNTNADANNGGWGDEGKNDNSGNADSSWDTGNNVKNNGNDNWDAPQDNKNNVWDARSASKSRSSSDEASNGPRDLYGPHGPYYALRSLRIGEPRPDAEEEPRYDVPKVLAMKKGSTKQVQPGPGYRYYKKRIVPEYTDTLENPYARFVFKYRTKEQLLTETGIRIDVEPTGDTEVQELQNMDKQALVEMLMRAKSALGGKVPSPPATPALSTDSSEAKVPTAVDAPKYSFLKYSLPPLRPNMTNSARKPSSTASKDSGGWDNQNNNGGDDWGNNDTNNTKGIDWGAAGWDGASAGKGRTHSAGPRMNRQRSGSTNSRQSRRSNGSARTAARNRDDEKYPRPKTPPDFAKQNEPAVDNWDKAGDATNWDNGQQASGPPNDGW